MKDKNEQLTTTLMELAERAKPYDEGSHTKSTFIEIIRYNPELEKEFEEQYSEEFAKQVEKKGIAFITNNITMKKRMNIKPMLRLRYCGMEEMPVIIIDY